MVKIKDIELATSEEICFPCDLTVGIAHWHADHNKLAQFTHYEDRCSVCDQLWGDVATSVHERCAFLYNNGVRDYAKCITYAYLPGGKSEPVTVEDPYTP